METAKLGIIGHGFVGKAVAQGFKDRNTEIKIYDKFQDTDSLETVVDFAEFIFICLPTPYKGERIDLGIIDSVLQEIALHVSGTNKIVILKSTIIPGSTDTYHKKYPKMLLAFNPEFLREKTYIEDFMHADRTVIGAYDTETYERVAKLYQDRFPDTPLFRATPKEAELAKYMANCFLATKVIFANEMFELAEKMGIDYQHVAEMVAADKRIGPSHISISPERGFGGKCFPKDTIALIGLYEELGLSPDLLKCMWEKNLRIRKVRDWEEIPFVKS